MRRSHGTFSGAYEKGLLDRFRRHLSFTLRDGGLKVKDEFTLTKEKDGTVSAILRIDGVNTEREVVIWEHIHNNHYGESEKVYAIRWQVPLKDWQGRSTYTINVLPKQDIC